MRTLLLSIALAAGAAHAGGLVGDPGSPFIGNVGMPRATAMGGAHAAIATSNDAILVNPAGLGQGHRYHFEADGLYDGSFPAQGLLFSVVDSTTTAVGTGLLFGRWATGSPDGRGEGWLAGISYSYELGSFYFGGQSKYLRFHTPDGLVAKWAQDFGLLARRGNFSYAVVMQNVSLSAIPLFPLTGTAAIAWGSDADWHLAFDYKADLTDLQNVKHKLSAGGEVLVGESFPLRAGVLYDPTVHATFLSAGLGLLTEKGGVQLVYRRKVHGGGDDQFFEAGVTLYLE